MSIFGWSLPPGCTAADIDRACGCDGPLDCPVCADGVEMHGDDCPKCGYVTCVTHGCVECQGLEKLRRYCAGVFCGRTMSAEAEGMYCSDACKQSSEIKCDLCGQYECQDKEGL